MKKSHLTLVSTFVTGILAVVVAVSGLGEPPPLSAQSETLTARFSNVPTSHDGTELMFNLSFTTEPDISYLTLREHALTVTGGTIVKTHRTVGNKHHNMEWGIRIVPGLDSNENLVPITVVLPATTDCTTQSAICTASDVPLSNSNEVTIPVSTDRPNRPGQPGDVTATQGRNIGEIKLTWTAASVDDGSEAAVRGYRVRYICGGGTEVARLDANTRLYVVKGIDRSTTCLLNVAAHNDGGYGPVAWAGSDSTHHRPLNPTEAPASITVASDPNSTGTKVSWKAPAAGDAPDSYQLAYWDVNMAQFQYVDHDSATSLEAVINVPPADLRTVAVRGRLEGVGYRSRGVLGSWAVGWHKSASESRLDTMAQSSSLSLSLDHSGGKAIEFDEDAGLECPSIGGLYVDTGTDTAWIADSCSKWVNAFNISSDGTLTHNVDKSLTTGEMYPEGGLGRLDPQHGPYSLWSDGAILWVGDRDLGMLLPYRLSDGGLLFDRRILLGPHRPILGHSFLSAVALWSDGKTMWVADSMIASQVFAMKINPGWWIVDPPNLFVPSAFDSCYIPEVPRISDIMPREACADQMTVRAALDDPNYDEIFGAYSDGRWLWIGVDYYKNAHKAGRLLAFNLLTGERAAGRDIALHREIKNPIGMWSDGENLWVVDDRTKRLYTFNIPVSSVRAQSSNNPATGLPAISGTTHEGETLTASVSGIEDADGTDNTAFAYQWQADSVDIPGATGSRLELTDSQVGKIIRVRVSFTDDQGNREMLTSAATSPVKAILRARFTDDSSSTHDGQTAFTFGLRLSEEPDSSLDAAAVRDHVFTITGGTITGVRKPYGSSSASWDITITPNDDGDVTITLPATTDCGDDGAICTSDGRKLVAGLALTVGALTWTTSTPARARRFSPRRL